MTDTEMADNPVWAYEFYDGAPVNSNMHEFDAQAPADSSTEDDVPARRPFGDVTGNFSEFYASLVTSAADIKSPERNKRLSTSRFSPNRPVTAAKRLWSTELPPLPPAANALMPRATMLSGIRPLQQQDESSSPTRHPSRSASLSSSGNAQAQGGPSNTTLFAPRPSVRRSLASSSMGFGLPDPDEISAAGTGFHTDPDGALPFPLPSELGLPSEDAGEASVTETDENSLTALPKHVSMGGSRSAPQSPFQLRR